MFEFYPEPVLFVGGAGCKSCAHLREQNALLRASNAQLRAELAAARLSVQQGRAQLEALQGRIAALSKNSQTSSKPPSSDIVKAERRSRKAKRKRGAQPGHRRHERAPFAPEELTAPPFEHYAPAVCPHCGGAGVPDPDWTPKVMQYVELEQVPLKKEEHRYHACRCLDCQQLYSAEASAPMQAAGLCGPRLTAPIGYLKSALHASFSTIRRFLRDVVGLPLSRGYLCKLIGKVSRSLQDPYEELIAALVHQPALQVDETGHKDNGKRFWTWVFRAELYVLFKIADNRSSQVLIDLLGTEFNGVLGCDFFSAYRKYMREFDVRVQFCLAHLIREIRFLCELPPGIGCSYGQKLLKPIREMFALIARGQERGLDRHQMSADLDLARKRILRVADQQAPPPGAGGPGAKAAWNLAQRLRRYGEAYFQFITTPEIQPTNNLAEQAIRFVVIDRLVTQGTRSLKGRQFCERLWTVLATCTAQKRPVLDYLIKAVEAYFHNQPAPSLMPAGP